MDVIASTAFGLEVNSQKNADDPFVASVKHVIDQSYTHTSILLKCTCPYTFRYNSNIADLQQNVWENIQNNRFLQTTVKIFTSIFCSFIFLFIHNYELQPYNRTLSHIIVIA